MALSEQEQRALREIERSLLADDPTFGASVADVGVDQTGAFSLRGIATIVVGLVLLVGGVALSQMSLWFVGISIVGFLVMLAGGISMLKGKGAKLKDTARPKKASRGSDNRLGGRMEENFRRRFEN